MKKEEVKLEERREEKASFEEMEKAEELGGAQDYLTGVGIGIGIVVGIVTLT